MVWRKDHKAGTNADIRLSNTQSTKAKLKIHGLNSISKERNGVLSGSFTQSSNKLIFYWWLHTPGVPPTHTSDDPYAMKSCHSSSWRE